MAPRGSDRPAHRLRLDVSQLSGEAQALQELVARYNAHEPDPNRRMAAWKAGLQLLTHRDPEGSLRRKLGALPEPGPEPEERQIQLWREETLLHATLAGPLPLEQPYFSIEAALDVPFPLEAGEIFFVAAGGGPGAALFGQATVRAVLQRAASVETGAPALPPPIEGPLAPGELLDAWSVWADRLMDQGDARGELVALHVAGKDGDALLHLHREALLGPFAPERAPHVELDWQLGYWRRATVHWTPALERTSTLGEQLALLMAHPSARVLRQLDVRCTLRGQQATATWREMGAQLARCGPLPLRELSLTSTTSSPNRELSGRCSLGPLWTALPELEALRVACREVDLGDVHAPRLLRVCLEADQMGSALEKLCASRAPVEELEVSIASQGPDGLAVLLRGPPPSMRSLRVTGCTSLEALLDALLRSGVLARLQRLSVRALTHRTLREPHLHAFWPHLRHLQELHLDGFPVHGKKRLTDAMAALRLTA